MTHALALEPRRSRALSLLLDAVILVALLGGLDYWLLPPSIALLEMNPSPYLLIPLLLGGRYGFLEGVVGGALATGVILAGEFATEGTLAAKLLIEERYAFLSLFLLGALAGELQAFYHRKLRSLEARNEQLQRKIKRLDDEFNILRESKDELEQALASSDNEVVALDTHIRRLYEYSGKELYSAILQLLNSQARVMAAAYYTPGNHEGHLKLECEFGTAGQMPQELTPGQIELVDLAIENRTIVHIKDPWDEIDLSEEYLVAVPLIDWEGELLGLILIARIPLVSLTHRNVRLINAMSRWITEVVSVKTRTHLYKPGSSPNIVRPVFRKDYFERVLQGCIAGYHEHRIPSTIVRLALPAVPKETQEILEHAITSVVRTGDFAAELDLKCPNLVVLLPLTGERGASIFLERCLQRCEQEELLRGQLTSRTWILDNKTKLRDVWHEISKTPFAHDSQAA